MGFFLDFLLNPYMFQRGYSQARPKASQQRQYRAYQNYIQPVLNGEEPYYFSNYRNSLKQVKRHGLDVSRSDARNFRQYAKNREDWYNEDGTVKEGLSRRQNRRANRAKAAVKSFQQNVKPKTKVRTQTSSTSNAEQTQARWAASNFIKNGYDRNAAAEYANYTNLSGIQGLWNGLTEYDFYNSLSAPAKRAYLAQRQYWINAGLLPQEGLATLNPVSEQDMTDYIRNNLTDWYKIFYEDNGYADEYQQMHPVQGEETKRLQKLYGISAASKVTSWTPANSPVRTSGFEQNISVTDAKNTKNTRDTELGNKLVQEATDYLKGLEYEVEQGQIQAKNGKLIVDGKEMTLDELKQTYY